MKNINDFNFDSFSHGQIKSKLWLCNKLEPYITNDDRLVILGSWYNILGFMMLTRNPDLHSITGVDIDNNAVEVSNKITDFWKIEFNNVNNIVSDMNSIPVPYDVVINCSSEHNDDMSWFDNINDGTLVCIQSSNMTSPDEPWFIKNPSATIDDFKKKYKLTKVNFLDQIRIDYGSWGYDRYMVIGIK